MRKRERGSEKGYREKEKKIRETLMRRDGDAERPQQNEREREREKKSKTAVRHSSEANRQRRKS